MKINELVSEIQKHLTPTPDWEDPNKLANLLMTLASYYSTLGPHIALAENDEMKAEMQYKTLREQCKLDHINSKMAIKKAESMSMLDPEVIAAQGEYINRKYQARLLFITRQSIDKTLDTGRSKLTQLAREKGSTIHAT